MGDFLSTKFQKSTKKVEFVALLKQKFYFVPRGTIVENFFARKNSPLYLTLKNPYNKKFLVALLFCKLFN